MKLLKIHFLLQLIILFGFVNQHLCCNKAQAPQNPQTIEEKENRNEGALDSIATERITLDSTTTQTTITKKGVGEPEKLEARTLSIDGLNESTSTTEKITTTKKEKEEYEKLRLALLEYDILNGVAINLSLPNNSPSSPGCPKPLPWITWVEGHSHWYDVGMGNTPWVYYKKPGEGVKCFPTTFQGPCHPDMVLYAEESSQYGHCNCKCDDERAFRINAACCKTIRESMDSLKAATYKFLLNVKQWDSCRLLYEQGHCGTQNREILGKTLDLYCERRSCPLGKERSDLMFYDMETGQCYKFGGLCLRNVLSDISVYHIDIHFNYRHEYHEKLNAICLCMRDFHLWDMPGMGHKIIDPNSCSKDEKFSIIFGKCVKQISRN